MKTRAELAFNVLDPERTGFITPRQLKILSSKLSDTDVKALMTKVVLLDTHLYLGYTYYHMFGFHWRNMIELLSC